MTKDKAMKLLAENKPQAVVLFLSRQGLKIPYLASDLNPIEKPNQYKELIQITKKFFDQ